MDGHTGVTVREILSTLVDQGQGGSGERLVCRACGHAITSTRERLVVDGAHEHRKTNPAGFDFHIGCFHPAHGAQGWGPASAEHTWFAGHTWQFAVCAEGGAHLGWVFRREGSGFHGLILVRPRPEAERGAAA